MDGKQIPEGWSILANICLTHQLDLVTRLEDDSHMDVHKGFKLERWLQPETKPSDFIPFGAGPRYCLGYNLALLEMKVFLATLARRIDSYQLVNGDNKIKWNPATMIPKPIDGVLIKDIKVTPSRQVQRTQG
jgi:cytochrome P450